MTLRSLFAFLTAALLTACAPVSSPRTQAFAEIEAPAVWRVADEDTTIWLFGTIHVLPAGYEWRNEVIDAAVAESDELVIETVLSGDPSESAALLMRLGLGRGLPPIGERVAEDTNAPPSPQ